MDECERKHRSAANAVGGSTARACDGCLRRRARWYCGADDAFLCQACDASVHSANSLARRHQRLRLHTASSSTLSFPILDTDETGHPAPISWSKRKARTPRPYQQQIKPQSSPNPEPLVPDLDMEEDEIELHHICRVPVLDPLFTDFCTPLDQNLAPPASPVDMLEYGLENLDVECLLGVGLDDANESSLYNMDEFTVVEGEDSSRIKMEEDREAMDNFYLTSRVIAEEHLEGEGVGVFKKMGLRLDYDAVIDAWSRSSGSLPWAGGDRPLFDSEATFIGPVWFKDLSESGKLWSRGRWGASVGEEREARVTRYKEKRRTRLFAKKIRYEVRKLNAEKRPRMKGRFVKRTTSSTGSGTVFSYQ